MEQRQAGTVKCCGLPRAAVERGVLQQGLALGSRRVWDRAGWSQGKVFIGRGEDEMRQAGRPAAGQAGRRRL